MSDRRLYTLRITEAALQNTPGSNRQQLNRLKAVGGQGSATPTGQEPGEIRLEGQYRDDLAELLGTEARELLSAAQYDYLPYYFIQNAATDDVHPDAGYYPSSETRNGRVVPKTSGVVSFDIQLTREGTRRTHHRRLKTDVTQRTHEFGTETAVSIGVPAAARNVRWLDTDGTTRASATINTTDTAELGDVDLYRVDTAPTGDNPQLTYDLAYADAGNVDAKVFDTWNNPEVDTEGRFAWQQVYTADHDYRGDVILENGLIQLRIDLSTDPLELSVDQYASGSWSRTTLGTSDWRLTDVDVRSVAAPEVRAFMTFTDTTGSDTHTLEAVVHRGWSVVQFLEPVDSEQNLLQSSVAPSGLVDRLDPIAAATITDPEVRQGLIRRNKIPL